MRKPAWHLAQLNLATLSAPLDSPQLADFVARLDEINALADASDGFVWRLVSENGDATGGDATTADHPFNDDVIVNLSVWASVESLHVYVYRTVHTKVMARRKEWFERMKEAYSVLWWVPEGHRPTPFEAERRLELLKSEGPTAEAFTFKCAFPPPGHSQPAPLQTSTFDDTCPA